jgi:hypothetical protein
MSSIACSDAVQEIEQNQIAYVLLYKERNTGPGIPVNSIVSIFVIPRSASSVPANPQASPNQIGVDARFPDKVCYPQLLAAVKQENKHLSKSEQIEVDWYYTVT